jgi:hypothetical protein
LPSTVHCLQCSEYIGEVPEWFSRLLAGSAYGGKTVVMFHKIGEVPEWFNGAVSKTVVLKGTPGSNPGLSAFL